MKLLSGRRRHQWGGGRGDIGAEARENRGRDGYGRREKKGREAGSVQPPKLSRPRNDPHFSSRRPRSDPQLIVGMELLFRLGISTNRLQRLRS